MLVVNTDIGRRREQADERPPICPACGVTMGITVDDEGRITFICLECGFRDEYGERPTRR